MEKNVRKLDPLISCVVPDCKNTVLKCPKKHFFYVPKSTRSQWCAAVKKTKVPSGSVYICEDHLNLEEDLLNYKDWMEKKVKRPRLKPQIPSRFQNVNTDPTFPSTSGHLDPLPNKQDKGVLCIPDRCNKSSQIRPSMTNRSVGTKRIITKPYQAEVEEQSSEGHYPSTVGSTTEFSDTETSSNIYIHKSVLAGRSFILNLIENKSFTYIGVPKQYFWIIQHLSNEFKIPTLHIIVTLYKVKNNETFAKIKDFFEISISTLWRIFYKTLAALSVFFAQLVYWPKPHDIKRNLPSSFTTSKDYASVQSIIDCFEIEVEKPSKPIGQALTWSQYKSCNTVKYLISATPDGFINFISEGYGGRISDICLVDQSGYLEKVPAGASVHRSSSATVSDLLEKNTPCRPIFYQTGKNTFDFFPPLDPKIYGFFRGAAGTTSSWQRHAISH